jgi:membrane protease YdiL (CAAX protease family)
MTVATTSTVEAARWGKLAVVFEVVAMLVAANFALWWIEATLHFVDVGSVMRSVSADDGPARGTYVGVVLLLHLTLRGVIFCAIVFAVGLVRGYRDPFRYGLRTGTRPIFGLILLALLAFCVGQFPTHCLAIVGHYHLIGPATGGVGSEPHHFLRLLRGASFWTLYVIALCVVVPLHEEFFFRGYAQRRLESGFGAAGAIVIGAVFFTLQHLSEYLYRLDGLNIAILLCMAFDALVVGCLYWRTRSLLPCVITHAACNAPLPGFQYRLILTGVAIIVAIVTHRRWTFVARRFLQSLRRRTDLPALGVATLLLAAAMVCFAIFAGAVAKPVALAGVVAWLYTAVEQRRAGVRAAAVQSDAGGTV